MTIEENKALVRRFIAEVFEQGRLDAVDEFVADDFVGHTWPGDGKIGLKQAMSASQRDSPMPSSRSTT